MTGRFEAHITVDQQHAREVETLADTHGWVFSVIAGCPLLGKGTYCYLTTYDPDGDTILKKVQEMQVRLHDQHIMELRMKIEDIVFDTRTGVNRL